MSKQVFGYVRVSTAEQNDARQRDALASYCIPRRNLYADKQSGKDFDRPAYKRLVKRLRPGDLVIVKSIDRLGRDYSDIIEQWRVITREKGADIKVLDMPLLDTTYCKDLLGTFISDLVLSVLSFTAQIEREYILSRQAEGIAAAKTRGIRFGPPPRPLPEDFHKLFAQWRSGEISNAAELATLCDMSRRTLFRRLKETQR
jgi:DNA invertase Pin-like site-specific DNA recombinase